MAKVAPQPDTPSHRESTSRQKYGAEDSPLIETEINEQDAALGRLLVTFNMPDNPTPAETLLAKEIVRVDHRSLHTLPPHSKERGEIRDLLVNVATFLQARQVEAGRALLKETETVYYRHFQARNRLRYICGMLVGIAGMIVFGLLITLLPGALSTLFPPTMVPMILLFAGMGAITSVLTRLGSIDLRDQTSPWMVFVSGVARPVTAVCLALVVDLVLSLRIFDIHVGVETQGSALPQGLFAVAAFLSGFSERFAQDVLARVGGDGNNASGRKSSTSSPD